MVNQESQSRQEPTYVVHAIVVGGIVIALWAMTFVVFDILGDPARSAQLGDSFGPVNALFSGLAFAGVVYAILLQRRELRLQRDELEATRAELKGQREQLEAQNTIFQRQGFEGGFFHLVNLWMSQVELMSVTVDTPNSDGTATITGKRAISHLWLRLRNVGRSRNILSRTESDIEMQQAINATYVAFFEAHADQLGHYFRSLYHIVKFIDASAPSPKRLYVRIIRAQLSSSELGLVFYNCLSPFGASFKPLVERYRLLKNISDEYLIASWHRHLFDSCAFGRDPSVPEDE